MTMKHKGCFAGAPLAAALLALPAQAKAIDQSDIGFTVAHTAQVTAAPEAVWTMLRTPDKWWSAEHSWSGDAANFRSEEHTSELQSLMRISYAVFCLKKKKPKKQKLNNRYIITISLNRINNTQQHKCRHNTTSPKQPS